MSDNSRQNAATSRFEGAALLEGARIRVLLVVGDDAFRRNIRERLPMPSPESRREFMTCEFFRHGTIVSLVVMLILAVAFVTIWPLPGMRSS